MINNYSNTAKWNISFKTKPLTNDTLALEETHAYDLIISSFPNAIETRRFFITALYVFLPVIIHPFKPLGLLLNRKV